MANDEAEEQDEVGAPTPSKSGCGWQVAIAVVLIGLALLAAFGRWVGSRIES